MYRCGAIRLKSRWCIVSPQYCLNTIHEGVVLLDEERSGEYVLGISCPIERNKDVIPFLALGVVIFHIHRSVFTYMCWLIWSSAETGSSSLYVYQN